MSVSMSASTRLRSVYASTSMVLGVIVFTASLVQLQPGRPLILALYLITASVAALLTAHPPMEGGIPAGFLVVLLGMHELNRSEILVVACVATLIYEVFRGVKGRLREVFVRVGGAATSTFAAYAVFHLVDSALGTNPLLPLPLLMASVTFFWYCLTVCATAKPPNVSLLQAYRQDAPWLLPWFIGATYVASMIWYTSTHTRTFSGFLALPVIVVAHILYRLSLRLQAQERKHHDELSALHLRVIETLALTVEAKDCNTHLHLRRVQVYAVAIGKELGLSPLE